jgi:hypothetical protein
MIQLHLLLTVSFVVIPQRSGGICFSLLHLGFSPLNQHQAQGCL